MQHLFHRTRTSIAVGAALYSISSLVSAGYDVRSPAIGNADNIENIDGTSAVTISVLDNDGINIDPTTLDISTANPTKGSVAIIGENIVYTPNAGFSGTDSFTYQITELDWRSSPSSITTNLAGISSNRPIASSYDESTPPNTAPIHDGQSSQPPGFWNQSPLPTGVVGKSYSPNSSTSLLPGCNSDDANVPAINMDVVWHAERSGADARGNMFTMTSAEIPTPIGSTDIVLKINPFEPSTIRLNGSDFVTNSGNIATPNSNWNFTATGKWVDLTPDQFESMTVHILASTVRDKTWYVHDTSFSATVDYSQCSLHTATVNVVLSDADIVVEPGSQTDLDEDKDGIPDAVEGSMDTDDDGIADYLDLDSDNDSITDIIEAGGVDIDFDGKVDESTKENSINSPTDTDGDGTPNFQEVDSNDDGVFDIAETSESSADTNNDGMRDNFVDTNSDGLDDSLLNNQLTLNDSDNDGTPDYAEVVKKSSGGGLWGLLPSIALTLLTLTRIRRRQQSKAPYKNRN